MSIHLLSPNTAPPTLGSQPHLCRLPHSHSHHHMTHQHMAEPPTMNGHIPNPPSARPRASRHNLISLKLHQHLLIANLGLSGLLQPRRQSALQQKPFLVQCLAARAATDQHPRARPSHAHEKTARAIPSRRKTRPVSESDSRALSVTSSRKILSTTASSNGFQIATGPMNTRCFATCLCSRSSSNSVADMERLQAGDDASQQPLRRNFHSGKALQINLPP